MALKTDLLYVTSFNERIFKLSGLRLLYTFIQHKINATLLICYEDKQNTGYLNSIIEKKFNNFIFFKLSDYRYLNSFLYENRNLIIEKHGGRKKTLYDNQWNNAFSLWFRKIASSKYALDTYKNNIDYLVWIDADCFFNYHLNNDIIKTAFNNTYCFYHLGKWRYENNAKSIESGFIGFKKNDGFELLYKVIKEYDNQKFIKYKRWDDGHVMGQIILNSNIKSIDLASNVPKRTTWNVIDKCMFKNYIIHYKGCHHSEKKKNQYKIMDYNTILNNLLKI